MTFEFRLGIWQFRLICVLDFVYCYCALLVCWFVLPVCFGFVAVCVLLWFAFCL